MKESFLKRVRPTIKFKLDLTGLGFAVGAAAGSVLGNTFGLPEIGAAVGGLASAIKISYDPSAKKPKKIPDERKPYAYLYHVWEEFGK